MKNTYWLLIISYVLVLFWVMYMSYQLGYINGEITGRIAEMKNCINILEVLNDTLA